MNERQERLSADANSSSIAHRLYSMGNQQPIGLPMSKKTGRPPKFATPEEMQAAVDTYFEREAFVTSPDGEQVYCPTVSGLAYHLDMSTESLRRYSEKDDFCAIVRRAKQRIEQSLEMRAFGNNPTGAIFNLKCNFGWQDKQVIAGDPDAPLLPTAIKVTYE